jgi:CHAT domain-containing protein
MLKLLLPAFGLAAMLMSCTTLPPSAYVNGGGAKVSAARIALGANQAGEQCAATRDAHGALIFCGNWSQPSATVVDGPSSSRAGILTLATSSDWRAGVEQQYACAAPTATSILDGDPAELLTCTQRLGGWPHVALVALVRGRAFYADGVQPAFPVMQRAIGIAAGVLPARKARALPVTTSDRLLANRLAAEAFSSGDIGTYDKLMRVGAETNQQEDFPAAITAYRAALALQQKTLGVDNPNTVTALTDLALNLSDAQRYHQAASLFATAATLAPRSADPTARPALEHARGLDALNQHHPHRAMMLLHRAALEYAATLPPDLVHPRGDQVSHAGLFGLAQGASGAARLLTAQSIVLDPVTQLRLLGLIESLRYQAIAALELHQASRAALLIRRANQIAIGNGIAPVVLNARLDRTEAAIDVANGQEANADAKLSAAGAGFARALPGSRPVANTGLLRADVLVSQHHDAEAVPICRKSVALLTGLRLGTSARLISPCLSALNQRARQNPARAEPIHAEMFAMAELAQGTTTSAEIAEAAARLAAGAKNPKVAAAIRAHQDAVARLNRLYRQRDSLARARQSGKQVTPAAIKTIDAQIRQATDGLNAADLAVQAAAPNFGQLVQAVVPAKAVLKRLHPQEAFLDIMVSRHHAWLFYLSDNRVRVARTGTGDAAMTKLVQIVRKSVEPTQAGLPPFAMHAAYQIYQATLAPFATALKHTTALVIAPSGSLLSLPFALLPTRNVTADNNVTDDKLATAPWLVRRATLDYVPAAANFVSLRKIADTSTATQPWFGFGDFHQVTEAQAAASFPSATCADSAQLFAGLPNLPSAKLELAAARALFKASPQDELLGAQFTVPAVEHKDLAPFRILHFATHAILPSELPCATEPAIITSAPPGARSAAQAMLTSADVANLHLNANLVILSACNTGGGNGRSGGEALSGLARSFFFAGARALMVTQWSVSDQVSAYLVATDLAHVQQGEGASASLRAVQLALINGAGHGLPAGIADPFYWAPFVVIGDGGRADRAAAISSPVGSGGGKS